MELNDKVTQLEDEIKILKNEIQAVLLDLRESYLNNKNPFNVSEPPVNEQPSAANQPVLQQIPAEPEPAKEPLIIQSISPAGTDETAIPGMGRPLETGESASNVLDEAGFSEGTEQEQKENVSAKVNSTQKELHGVMKEWRAYTGASGIFNQSDKDASRIENIEISSISKLAQWVENSTNRLGARRTETMLDVAEMMGYIGDELKNILAKLIISTSADEVNKIDARDYLSSWLELATILGKDNKPEIALFYMLCQEAENR